VDALLRHLPRRMGALLGLGADGRPAGAAPAGAADARAALLRLLAQLLALAPQRALSPAAPAAKVLLGFYVGVLELRRAPSHERRDRTHHAWARPMQVGVAWLSGLDRPQRVRALRGAVRSALAGRASARQALARQARVHDTPGARCAGGWLMRSRARRRSSC